MSKTIHATKTIEIGSHNDVVIIDKLFGPTVFANIRITPNVEKGVWLIERQWINTGRWIEWCTIPAQIDEEFTKRIEL